MGIPLDAGHYVVSGVASGSESWAFGWWVSDTDHNSGSDLDINSAWPAFRDAFLNKQSTDVVITAYDFYRYGAGGTAVFHDHNDVNHPGTGSANGLPLQLACVLTLRSSTLSRQGRGRVYLPMTSTANIGAGHMWASAVVDQLVDDFALFLTTQNIGADHPVIVSRVGSAMHTVTSVDADYVPDTQRRRTRKLSSSRHAHSVG